MLRIGFKIQDTNINTLLFADHQLVIAEEYEDFEYMMRKLMEAYDLKGIQIQFEGNKIYGYRRYMV